MAETASIEQNARVVFPKLHAAILKKTQDFIQSAENTTSDEFFNSFPHGFFEGWEEVGLTELRPLAAELLSEPYKVITEANLTIANANSNLMEVFPLEVAIGNYLNDFLNYMLPRIVNLEDWRRGFDKHYRIFEQEYLSDAFTVECFGHIGNFAYDYAGMGILNDHSHVIVLSRLSMGIKYEDWCNKTADYFRVQKALKERYPRQIKIDFDRHTQFFKYRLEIKKTAFGKPTFDPYEIMRKFVLAVKLLTPYWGKPYCDAVAIFHQGCLSPGESAVRTLVFPEAQVEDDREAAEPKGPANTWLERLWTKLEQADYTRLIALDHHLDDSLRRGWRSARNPHSKVLEVMDNLERLSDYFSAFDSMYQMMGWTSNKTLPGPISFLTGHLVTYKRTPQDQRNPDQFQEVAKFICQLYLIRCDYEHGRVRDALSKIGSVETFKGMLRQMKAYLCQVAVLYVMNEDFGSQLARVEKDGCSRLRTVYY